MISENGSIENVDFNGVLRVIGKDSITIARQHEKDFTVFPESIAISDNGDIFYVIGSKIRAMNAKGEIMGEIDARGEVGTSLEALAELGNPTEIAHLKGNEFAVLIGNAVLKFSLNENAFK